MSDTKQTPLIDILIRERIDLINAEYDPGIKAAQNVVNGILEDKEAQIDSARKRLKPLAGHTSIVTGYMRAMKSGHTNLCKVTDDTYRELEETFFKLIKRIDSVVEPRRLALIDLWIDQYEDEWVRENENLNESHKLFYDAMLNALYLWKEELTQQWLERESNHIDRITHA